VTRSVEIPDEAVTEAADAISGHQIGSGYYALTVGFPEATEMARAALVAARPYLMPDREAMYWAISEASERQGVDKFLEEEDLDAFVSAVLALLSTEVTQ
jgi:hypothetical protein